MAYRDEVYWIERDSIAIAALDRTATSIASEFTGPTGSKTVTVFAIKLDDTFDTSTGTGKIGPAESPTIPAEFHEAITYKVLARLYSQNPTTIQVSSFWEQKFNAAIVEAKKYANTGRDGGLAKIKPMEY
jgi:hypothetical protein